MAELEGKNFGKLSPQEQLELKDLGIREQTIQELLHRLIREQEAQIPKREEWFAKIRDKYRIPATDTIRITEDHWIYQVRR